MAEEKELKTIYIAETDGMIRVYNDLVKIRSQYQYAIGLGKDISNYIDKLKLIIEERQRVFNNK